MVRSVDTFVVEKTKEAGVTGFLIFSPTLRELLCIPRVHSGNMLTRFYSDGRGSGAWNQLSPQIPALVQASIKYKQVYKFDEDRVSILLPAKCPSQYVNVMSKSPSRTHCSPS